MTDAGECPFGDDDGVLSWDVEISRNVLMKRRVSFPACCDRLGGGAL